MGRTGIPDYTAFSHRVWFCWAFISPCHFSTNSHRNSQLFYTFIKSSARKVRSGRYRELCAVLWNRVDESTAFHPKVLFSAWYEFKYSMQRGKVMRHWRLFVRSCRATVNYRKALHIFKNIFIQRLASVVFQHTNR